MGKGIEKSCAKTAWGLGAGETAVEPVRACLHGGGGPRIGEVTCGRSPYLSCKRDQIKILRGVPHFHVNRPKDYCFQYVFPVYPMIDQLRQFTSTVTSIFWLLFHCSVAFFARLHWPWAWQAIFDSIYYTAIPIIAYMIEIPAGFVQGSMYIIISIYKVLGVELICLAGNRGLTVPPPSVSSVYLK